MSYSKNILYLTSLILLMLTGCEADTSWAPLPGEGEEPVEVRLHATTYGAGVEVSRATTLDNQIGMTGGTYQNIALNYDNSATPNLSTANGSKIYYPLQTDIMKIYAYAPYSEEAYEEETDSVLVKAEWVNGCENYITDPIWAATTVTKDSPTGRLTFAHAMAKLKIYLVHDEGKIYDFFMVQMTFDRTQYGKMSVETGEIVAEKTNYNYQRTETQYGEVEMLPKDEVTQPNYEYTILPGTNLKSVNVMIAAGNGYKTFTQPFEVSPAFEAGKTTRIFINFGKIENPQVYGNLEDFNFEDEGTISI